MDIRPIFEWAPGNPINDNYEDMEQISASMDNANEDSP